MSELGIGIAATALGCYLLKLSGLALPSAALDHPIMVRATALMPVGLLAALVAVQGFSTDNAVEFDARVPALVVAVACLVMRVPFILMLVAAAATAALWRVMF